MYAWLTPDIEPGAAVCRPVFLPAGIEYEAAFNGAFLLLCDASNWEKTGSAEPETIAAAFFDAFLKTQEVEVCLTIGTVLFTAGNDKPVNALWADGAEVSQTEYPLLYAVLGDTWGVAASGNFKLPDMRKRVPMGADAGASAAYGLGTYGGEEKHTLTIAEIPAHDHAIHSHLEGVIGVELLPASTPGLISGSTGSTGGGGEHENRPPYAALNAYIIAR